jgi:hypothetical protein
MLSLKPIVVSVYTKYVYTGIGPTSHAWNPHKNALGIHLVCSQLVDIQIALLFK